MQHVTALTMRKKFGHYLDLVANKKEPVIISRGHRPMVALIPAEQLEEYQRTVGDRAKREEAVRRMDRLRAELGREIGPVDTVELVRRVRGPI